MDRIRTYLFWMVLAAVVVGLLVVRFGPISALYAEAERGSTGLRKIEQDLDRLLRKGEKLPRPALIREAEKLAEHYKKVLASKEYQELAMDYRSEFWPPKRPDIYIDFRNPPKGPELQFLLINLYNAQRKQAEEVKKSFYHWNADPSQPLHTIQLPRDLGIGLPRTEGPLEGEAGLRQILAHQRILWLQKGLFKVITDPEVRITAVMKIVTTLADPNDVGFPGESRATPYVLLNWELEVELPLERIPVLLNRIAVSERHLQVQDLAIYAQPEAILDYRSGTLEPHLAEGVGGELYEGGVAEMKPSERRAERPSEGRPTVEDTHEVQRKLARALYRQGRLVNVVLKGVSYDFLRLPEGYKGWPT